MLLFFLSFLSFLLLSNIRKLMDVSFFLVVFNSLPYDGDEVDMVANPYHVKSRTGFVTAVDADGLQAKEHLGKTALLTVVHHTV